MLIVVKAGVVWVCKHWQICIIRSISDVSVGIPWIGSGALGKAVFTLVREVSVSLDILIFGRGGGFFSVICREVSRDSTRDTANKCFLELCAAFVHVFLGGWRV